MPRPGVWYHPKHADKQINDVVTALDGGGLERNEGPCPADDRKNAAPCPSRRKSKLDRKPHYSIPRCDWVPDTLDRASSTVVANVNN
jgi:hypothetical protein